MKFTFRNRSWCIAKIGVKPVGGTEVLTSGVSYGFDARVSITTTAQVYVRSFCMGIIPGVYNEQGGSFTETAESGHEFAYKMTGTSDYAKLERD